MNKNIKNPGNTGVLYIYLKLWFYHKLTKFSDVLALLKLIEDGLKYLPVLLGITRYVVPD